MVQDTCLEILFWKRKRNGTWCCRNGKERPNEAFTVFAADKTEPGAFNYPIYRMFVDAVTQDNCKQESAEGANQYHDVEKHNCRVRNHKTNQQLGRINVSRRYVVSVTTKDGEPILQHLLIDYTILQNICWKRRSNLCKNSKRFPATEEGEVF